METLQIRRLLQIILGIILASSILSWCGFAEEVWQTISSEKMQYTIQYPQEGWMTRLDFHKENVSEHVIVERAVLSNEAGVEISIEVWMDETDAKIVQWIDAHQSILGFTSAAMERTFASIRKIEALTYHYHSKTGESYDSTWTFFKFGNYVYRIAYLEKDYGDTLQIYRQIIATFEFITTSKALLEPLTSEKIKRLAKVESCDGYSDTCQCGASNPYPCCSGGNCTWWAWHNACCNWGVGLPSAGDAGNWAAVLGGQYGYPVSSTPAPNTIGCWKDNGISPQHVTWVKQVGGSQVFVSEMSWCVYGMKELWYNTSAFNQGFIYPKGGSNLCGDLGGRTLAAGTYDVCESGIYVNSGASLHIMPGVTLNYNGHSFTVNGQLIWGP